MKIIYKEHSSTENEKFQNLVLEHLAKLTQELTEVNSTISGLEQEIKEIKQNGVETNQRLGQVDQRLDRVEASVIRIENEHGGKINALFDAREVLHDQIQRILESQNRMEIKLDRMSLKVSAHEVELRKAK